MNSLFLTFLLLFSNNGVILNMAQEAEESLIHDIVKNIEANNPNEDEGIELLSLDESSFYYACTYKYTGEFAFSGGTDYMYRTQKDETSYCAFYSINYNWIIENENLSGHTYELTLEIPGSFPTTHHEHAIYDYATGKCFNKTPSNDCFSFDLGPNCEFGIQNGYIRFLIIDTIDLYHYERLYSSNIRYKVAVDDVEYGDYYSKKLGKNLQDMDLYYYRGYGSYPVILTIHGGTWTGGDKDYYDYLEKPKDPNYSIKLFDQGYIHANINYRLINNDENDERFTCLDMLQDIEMALDKVKEICGDNADMERIAMWGHSAGGHLAIMYSLLNSYGIPEYVDAKENTGVLKNPDRYFYPKYKTKFLITEAGPYYLDAVDSHAFSDAPSLKSIFDSLVYGKSIESSESDYNNHLWQISPRDLSDRRVPTFTIANYYSNDPLVKPDKIRETFTNKDFKVGGNYLEIIEKYTKNPTNPHDHYNDVSMGFVSTYLQKLRIYL